MTDYIPPPIPTTDELKARYVAANAARNIAHEMLEKRAIEESGLNVGDIIQYDNTRDPFKSRKHLDEHLVTRLYGIVNHRSNSVGVDLRATAITRRRTKNGWHATATRHYEINTVPRYRDDGIWKVVGHEDIPEA